MSRCFPFPPPGFVQNTALIDSIELQKERKEKKEKKKEKREKKKKTETSTDEIGKVDGKKHKDKKRQRDEKSPVDQKAGKDPASAGEGSGTTEERGSPAVQYICNSSDILHDSNKRRKLDDDTDDGKNSLGFGFRIRLPLVRIKDSTLPAAIAEQLEEWPALSTRTKHMSLTARQSQLPTVDGELHLPIARKMEPQAQTSRHLSPPESVRYSKPTGTKHMSLTARQSRRPTVAIRHGEPPVPIAKKTEPQTQTPRHLETLIQTSRRLSPPECIRYSEPQIPTTRQPQSPAVILRQPKHPASVAMQSEVLAKIAKQTKGTSAPTIKHPELPPQVAKHPKFHAPAIKQQNGNVTVAKQSDIPPKIVKKPKQTIKPTLKCPELAHPVVKQSDLHDPTIKQQKKSTQILDRSNARPAREHPCFSGRTEASLQQKEHKLPALVVMHAETHSVSDETCFSGRAEAAPSQQKIMTCSNKPHAILGFSGSSSSRRKEAMFRNLIENWTPPQLEIELPLDDLDWLSISESRHCHKGVTGCSIDGEPPLLGQSSLSSWQPQARLLPDANLYALPYVIPF